jgi:2-oxo-4-hydroxy-4-carboxy-5-ureidoimidazoline decarboxylase
MASGPHEVLNRLPRPEAQQALARCCGSQRWVLGMLERRPFGSLSELMTAADQVWSALARADYLEAFSHHPEIGADLAALRERFASTQAWSSAEQSGVARASEQTLLALRDDNQRYRERFGYIFIICASGLGAEAMSKALSARLDNDPELELGIAAAEQSKITKLRLAKL